MNMVGVPKRPEIALPDFTRAVGAEASAIVSFDPKLFGTAGNNGQMIAEIEANGKTAETFSDLARLVTGRTEVKRARRGLMDSLLSGKSLFSLGKAS